MKRKNILKFVSLLGIGSFVMLAAASCSQAATRTPNPNTPSDGGENNGISGENNNPGSNDGTNNADPELAAARTALTTLINSKNQNIELYVDYAKIQDVLTKAYDAAEAVLNNSASTAQNVKDAQTVLETAISTAARTKTDFNENNGDLVTAYNTLKETLKNEETNLNSVTASEFSAIKNNLTSLYETAKTIISETLVPKIGNSPQVETVTNANQAIVDATDRLERWKNNATTLNTGFIKEILKSTSLSVTAVDGAAAIQQQPGNYSFVGYRVNVDNVNWNFAQRKIWALDDAPLETTPVEGETQQSAPLTDVSWIYSLSGTDAKYTLNFRYFGASPTVYLYFPYKLVKSDDQVGLQYKLNDGNEAIPINFGNGATDNGETPTVDDIKIAKVALSNLNFNSNKIEFSVPVDKVAPMIGNMYLTSSNEATIKNKIYDSIFGNSVTTTEDNKTKVTVDTLSGYSLAADRSTIIYEYSSDMLTLDTQSVTGKKFYLIGWVGGTSQRGTKEGLNLVNVQMSPTSTENNSRNYTFYVNAPQAGNYYIKGIFASGSNRGLKFTAGTQNNNNVTLRNLMSGDNALKTFDTSSTTETGYMIDGDKKTLALVQGLNKIVVSGVSDLDSGNAANSGYFEFILNETQSQNT